MTSSVNPFNKLLKTLDVEGTVYKYYDLTGLNDPRYEKLPFSIRVLLEAAVRCCDNFQVKECDILNILDWENLQHKEGGVEVAFNPARVILQDFTGVPCVADFAAMRDIVKKLGGNPDKVNPLCPDFSKPFILQCDASNLGIGIVLAQLNENNEEHPIMYLSKKFSDRERKFSTTEKECAAIVFAVKKLRCYLDGHQKFQIQTDHNPLVWLEKNIGTNPRLLRWALLLQSYNYEIVHKKGKQHQNADSLSRALKA